jgi:hypothetical protein
MSSQVTGANGAGKRRKALAILIGVGVAVAGTLTFLALYPIIDGSYSVVYQSSGTPFIEVHFCSVPAVVLEGTTWACDVTITNINPSINHTISQVWVSNWPSADWVLIQPYGAHNLSALSSLTFSIQFEVPSVGGSYSFHVEFDVR